jgi:enterochelin esterase family protein
MRYIYLDCGLWDELNFQIGTRILSNKLKALGIAHDFELFNDGHINVPYRYDVSLPRLEKAIRA